MGRERGGGRRGPFDLDSEIAEGAGELPPEAVRLLAQISGFVRVPFGEVSKGDDAESHERHQGHGARCEPTLQDRAVSVPLRARGAFFCGVKALDFASLLFPQTFSDSARSPHFTSCFEPYLLLTSLEFAGAPRCFSPFLLGYFARCFFAFERVEPCPFSRLFGVRSIRLLLNALFFERQELLEREEDRAFDGRGGAGSSGIERGHGGAKPPVSPDFGAGRFLTNRRSGPVVLGVTSRIRFGIHEASGAAGNPTLDER